MRGGGGMEQGLSSYTVHRDMACHLIPFTVTKSVIPSILKGVYGGGGGGKDCHLIPFTLTVSVILSASP